MAEVLNFDTRAEADKTPDRQFRRWNLEIKLALKREKDWRKEAQTIWKKYRAKDRKKASFNILWANTDTLRPALYNSPPKPDVRRRFRQNDMLGKAVGELMERSLTYCSDAYDLDAIIKQDVLEALLPGRGVSRVRYVPSFKQVKVTEEQHEDLGESAEQDPDEPFEGEREEVEYEQCLFEHVQWDDFIHGPGKTWDEVPWQGFQHKLTRDDLIEKFGEEVGNEIELDATDDDDIQKKENDDIAGVFKRAQVWEIWDKEGGKVFFLAPSYRKGLIYAKSEVEGEEQGDPPLKLRDFFPVPRPLQLVEDTGTLVPTPLFHLYEEQAVELDDISARIKNLIKACRARGVYDSTLGELSELMKSADNELIPASQARAWMQNGGLDKAIWWMPIEQIARVFEILLKAREECKRVIYELTGISDIVRGETDPNETLGAQQMKANYSSIRLQRMQREVQRYVRDIMRIKAEVIGEHFSKETLAQMTGMNFPTALQKQAIQLQMQAIQQPQMPPQNVPLQQVPGMAQMSAQPPAPPPVPPQALQAMQNALSLPSWEDIMGVLKSDMQREFRVDVETNSTVAETLSQDMTGLKEVLTGLVQFWDGVGPAVQAGALSVEAVKAISLTIVRRARMGLEVEDAIESGMQQPKPQADPKAAAEAAKQQADERQAQHDQMLAQQQQAHEQQIAQREQQMEQAKAQAEAAAEERRMQMEAHFEQQRLNMETQAKAQQASMDAAFERFKALLDSITKIEVAEISAGATLDAAQVGAAKEGVQ